MKMSNYFFFTRREFPKDETNISSKLLIKSGLIIKNSNGIYSYSPLGLRVRQNIKNIIKEEFNKFKGNEVSLPTLINYEKIELSEKERVFKDEIYNIIDRNNKRMILCPSSDELFIELAKQKIESYKDLHFYLYQFSNKYRDEEHSEYGLIRKKEFEVMEGYSFDVDEGGLDVSYDKMFLMFKNIFSKLGINTQVVESDNSDNNGIISEEFQVICDFGDNEIVKCTNCTYSCLLEDASSKSIQSIKETEHKKLELVKTTNVKSIKDVSEYLNVFTGNIVKSLVCSVDGKYKMILLKGESELNIKKLMKLFKTTNIQIPSTYEIEKLDLKVGYLGPIETDLEIVADNEVKYMHNFICGSNKENYYYKNANYGRDFKIDRFADLKLFDSTSLCPKCKNKCEILKGVEVGQINKLGNNLSYLYDLKYTDEVNKNNYVKLGSYQIGIDRCISAIVEKSHDDDGIIWPFNVAPYKVCIVIANINEEEEEKYSNNLYNKLNELNIDTILDDRKESIGVKINDMDLIGIPIRIIVGNRLKDNIVEIKIRRENKIRSVKSDKVIEFITNIINNE